MASAGGTLQAQKTTLEAHVKTLINTELKEICRGEGLPVSGPKNQLQTRIFKRLDTLIANQDQQGLFALRHRIHNGGKAPLLSGPSHSFATSAAGIGAQPHSYGAIGNVFGGSIMSGLTGGRPLKETSLRFKESPFYEIREALTNTLEMPVFSSHRNSMNLPLTLPQTYVDRLRADSTLRILLYCAADTVKGAYTDISFPQQLEIKVGGEEVKANFKGLKNKPGSTRPADITAFIKKQANFVNNIAVTYALTHKTHKNQVYHLVAMLVKKHSVEDLVERIRNRSVISKQRVINEMVMKASDPDVVATSSVMSLKDPVSYTRIALPCRSTICTHNQCFDASSFLQLQEQAPTWTCPICNKVVAFEGLAVDQYVQDILQSTSRSVEQVTIEPSGTWSHGSIDNGRSNGRSNGVNGYDDDDDDSGDDLVEISDSRRPANMKIEASNTPFSFAGMTPPVPSPMAASMVPFVASAGSGPRPGQKRKSEVIDLTLSDDDEPAAKRPAYNTPNSLPDAGSARNGYPSYPRHSFHSTLPTNGSVPTQVAARSPFAINSMLNSTNTAPYSSPARSPLAGSNLEPINLISSPPNRPSPIRLDYSTLNGVPSARPLPSHHPPRPPSQIPRNSQGQSAQRSSLLNLAAGRESDHWG